MILVTAIFAGLAAGVLLAYWQKRTWKPPRLRFIWLVAVAFLPQFLTFYHPATRAWFTDDLAATGLIVSQALLLVFCWLNRKLPGMWLLAAGTACNLLVIAANGGFMPISPQTASALIPPEHAALEAGSRFGIKDILLQPSQTRLQFLSDQFLSPDVFPYRVAFSLGDVLIAAGIFWLVMITDKSPTHQPSDKGK